jgi:hypothetical protein
MNKYLDFDNRQKIFYYNIFLKENNCVIKIPIVEKTDKQTAIKTEKFQLTKYTFLINCEKRDYYYNHNHEVLMNE